jgi:thiol-disulfide isomerase/thioredoxin
MGKQFVLLIVLLGVAVVVARLLFAPDGQGTIAAGVSAPDFSAVATNGQTIRLSELRGRVVVLNFWATWCGPCRSLIPHEREMVKQFEGKPFAFIGISGDEKINDLRKMLASERMTWPNIFEGPGRPIARQYGIHYLPTIYVLDAAGVIRFKDARGADLESAVHGLLKEIQ